MLRYTRWNSDFEIILFKQLIASFFHLFIHCFQHSLGNLYIPGTNLSTATKNISNTAIVSVIMVFTCCLAVYEN